MKSISKVLIVVLSVVSLIIAIVAMCSVNVWKRAGNEKFLSELEQREESNKKLLAELERREEDQELVKTDLEVLKYDPMFPWIEGRMGCYIPEKTRTIDISVSSDTRYSYFIDGYRDPAYLEPVFSTG